VTLGAEKEPFFKSDRGAQEDRHASLKTNNEAEITNVIEYILSR
jgi:hypothetical protein